MYQLLNLFKSLIKDEEGATAVEYGVLIALIIAAVVVVIAVLGQQIENGFNAVSAALNNEGL